MKIYFSIYSNINKLYKIVIQGINEENKLNWKWMANRNKGENFSLKRNLLAKIKSWLNKFNLKGNLNFS